MASVLKLNSRMVTLASAIFQILVQEESMNLKEQLMSQKPIMKLLMKMKETKKVAVRAKILLVMLKM